MSSPYHTVSDSGSVSSPLTEYEFGSGRETGISNLPSLSISANDNLDERSVAGESEELPDVKSDTGLPSESPITSVMTAESLITESTNICGLLPVSHFKSDMLTAGVISVSPAR